MKLDLIWRQIKLSKSLFAQAKIIAEGQKLFQTEALETFVNKWTSTNAVAQKIFGTFSGYVYARP